MDELSKDFQSWAQDRGAAEAYRFSHRPSFHRPLDMTAWLDMGGGLWLDIRLWGAHAAEKSLRQPLDPAAWSMLGEALKRLYFWDKERWETKSGLDGSTWWLMGLRYGLHKSRMVWCPEPDTPAHELGWFFFNLIPPSFCPVMTLEQYQEMARIDSTMPGVDTVVVY